MAWKSCAGGNLSGLAHVEAMDFHLVLSPQSRRLLRAESDLWTRLASIKGHATLTGLGSEVGSELVGLQLWLVVSFFHIFLFILGQWRHLPVATSRAFGAH